MLLRSLYAAALVLVLAAGATAQTAPAKKTTKARTTARNTTMQGQASGSARGNRNDIGPAGNGAVGSTEEADGKGQNVYAAPGMPVNVDNPKKVEGYNGPAPAKPRSGTTLSPR